MDLFEYVSCVGLLLVFLTAWSDHKWKIMFTLLDYEVEKLKQAVESLMATNEEKVGLVLMKLLSYEFFMKPY